MLLITGNSAPVVLSASAEGAEVVISRGGSSAPPQAYKIEGAELTIRLRAGTHTLTATAPDGRRQTWEASISQGRETAHHFDFDAKAEGSSGSNGRNDSGAPQVRESGGAVRTAGFVVTGVGAAALIGGVITGILAKNKESEATDDCTPEIDSQGVAVQRCPQEAEAELESANDLASMTNYLLIGGGVLAATGVTMIIFGGPSETTSAKAAPPARSLRLQPLLGPRTAGLFASGTF
jgi:hypothetical protein